MDAKIFQNVVGGLVQEGSPVRVRIDNAEVSYDIERLEIVNGVVYLIVDSADVNIIPEVARG